MYVPGNCNKKTIFGGANRNGENSLYLEIRVPKERDGVEDEAERVLLREANNASEEEEPSSAAMGAEKISLALKSVVDRTNAVEEGDKTIG